MLAGLPFFTSFSFGATGLPHVLVAVFFGRNDTFGCSGVVLLSFLSNRARFHYGVSDPGRILVKLQQKTDIIKELGRFVSETQYNVQCSNMYTIFVLNFESANVPCTLQVRNEMEYKLCACTNSYG